MLVYMLHLDNDEVLLNKCFGRTCQIISSEVCAFCKPELCMFVNVVLIDCVLFSTFQDVCRVQ
jgi:hypothetical protein